MIKINKISAGMAAAGMACTISSLPQVAFSQDETVALEEITVTARKKAESLQDVPVSVTAISAQLDNPTVQNLQDMQNYVPNVSIDRIPGNNGASISIRGISFQETDKSLDPPAGVILDGVYLGVAAGALLNNFDLERVEVLRGPQGTLFGKNTTAGAINVIRTAPTKQFDAKIRVGAGDWGKREINAVVNAPLGESGGVKFYANRLEHDGYIENNIIGEDLGDVDYEQLGAMVAFDLTENLDVALTLERINDDSEVGAWSNFSRTTDSIACWSTLGGAVPGITTANVPFGSGCMEFDDESGEGKSSVNEPNSSEVTNDYRNLTVNWALGDWQLTAVTGYVDREEDFRVEYDANRNPFVHVDAAHRYSQTSQEFRVSGPLNDKATMTSGIYYWSSDYWQTQTSYDMWYFFGVGFGPEGGFNEGDISQGLTGEGDNTAYSLFASVDWELTDDLLLNLGGRYTQEEKTFTGGSGPFTYVPLGIDIVPSGPVNKLKDDWTEFSPKIALQYTVDGDLMVFGSYAKGFKSGGFFARTQDVYGMESYDPEYVDTLELGMKSEWFDNRVRFNATAFFSEYTDKQEDVIVPDSTGSVGTVVRNAADVDIQGLEIELTAAVTANLNVFMNLGLLDTEYKDFMADISGDGIATDNSGLVIRNAPERTLGIGADYVKQLTFGEFSANYNYRWRDEYQTIFGNDPLGLVDTTAFHNLSLNLNIEDKYEVSIYGRNLTDERYARVILIPPVSNFGQYTPPRHYGVSFTANF
ncbi:TonB-dependent receptor [Biformimicrobium ophioploci]|uniref:TonB-dependent receptor n=1 Tax=Biformimicrobium ophioploci TaxID=3036711 RepID=A0ABQ6M279_9GAMM|nr:TonB-dependent receptor [Microbulbifer sp. NKW57]GMG88372.1 TonB-dependent receptor [Microbulbifer sp. NKW57]